MVDLRAYPDRFPFVKALLPPTPPLPPRHPGVMANECGDGHGCRCRIWGAGMLEEDLLAMIVVLSRQELAMRTKQVTPWIVLLWHAVAMLAACGSGSPGAGAGGAGGATSGAAGIGGAAGGSGAAGGDHDGGQSDAAADAGHIDGDEGDATPCAGTDIVEKLRCIPGVTVTELGMTAGARQFDITFDQLADHAHPDGAHFQQRIRLRHRSEDAPLLLGTNGYALAVTPSEIETAFQLNELDVEHRYFSTSIPDGDVDWKLLNIAQAAADHHAITIAFKKIYKKKWLNSGVSKGGTTSIYHRRFFPGDVDATVAYVAPNNLALPDQRYVPFLQNVGGDANASCRERIKEVQRALLTRRSEIVPLIVGPFERLGGPDIVIEHAVLEMPFVYWQTIPLDHPMYGCAMIPAADAPSESLFRFFFAASALRSFSDPGLRISEVYLHQCAHELGYPAVEEAHLAGLLQHRNTYSVTAYLPIGVEVPPWDPNAMVDIQNWVKSEGSTLMLIYGELDPWTAGQFELGNAVDSHRFTAPGANHRANLQALKPADLANALQILERWLGVPPVAPLRSAEPERDGEEVFHRL